MKFRAIRKNYTEGQIWEIGQVIEAEKCPNHHFVSYDVKAIDVVSVTNDPMKGQAVNNDSPVSFSELAAIPKPQGGFAAGLNTDVSRGMRGRPRKK